MNAKDKALAESILRHLCIGRRICGVTFYAIPMLTLDTDDQHSGERSATLTVEGEWAVLNGIPGTLPPMYWPEGEDKQLERERMSELVTAAGRLGWSPIVDAKLYENAPHLLLTFGNGQTLYINGHHERYESWTIAAGSLPADSGFRVVAGPEDELAIWCPENFPRPEGTGDAARPSGVIISRKDGKVRRSRSVD